MTPEPVKAMDLNHREEQALYRQRWLGLAPKPPARGSNSYDAFISYRSSDRDWALALYDTMKLAGWDPFLDQFELVPGSNLETSLTEHMQASSSGVILWSSRTKDSEWCRKERQAMAVIAQRNPKFHYIFAKLDAEPLPIFAASDLYEDFESSPEGPQGASLVRLLCGMTGQKPNPEAVRLAQEVAEDTKQVLIAIKAAIEAENPGKLRDIGVSLHAGLLASSGPIVEAARGLISMKKCDEALEVLAQAEAHFPKSVAVKQYKGLALRRSKRYQEAIDVLSELKVAGHQDPETMGILAAAWDGRYQETRRLLDLRRSRELYRTAFQADPTSHYTGINAASKSLFLGEVEEAMRLADLVLPLVATANDGKDFWAACTLGEAHLLKRALESAKAQYQKVIDLHGGRTGDLAGTRDQARRICEAYQLSAEETTKVLSPFELIDG